MTAKLSISLNAAQRAYALDLVESGQYRSLGAVLQHGLELLRIQRDAQDAETAALRALLKERNRGPFVGMKESRTRTEWMIAARKTRAKRTGTADLTDGEADDWVRKNTDAINRDLATARKSLRAGQGRKWDFAKFVARAQKRSAKRRRKRKLDAEKS